MTNDTSALATEDAVIRTFLIADVRGYTRYTQQHGDEAAAQLTSEFASRARAGVEAHGGTVVELRGDEVLAVFASARQALRAAVALQNQMMSEGEADLPLPVGIGLDAGEAVSVDGGYRGGALNLASRLCALAAPGQVLASDAVVHLGRAIPGIRYVELAPRIVKGFDDPIRVTEIVPEHDDGQAHGARPHTASKRSRLPDGAFLGARPDDRLIGRSQELEVCLHVLDRVRQGAGRTLLLSGEPGIGKTRLAQEIAVAADGLDFLLGAGICSPQRQMSPFFPFVDALTALYLASPEQTQANVRMRCAALGRLLPDLGVAPPEPSARGQEEHVKLLRAITDFLHLVAESSPVAVMLDDLQWADAASIDLLDYLARSTRSYPVLILGTYRSDEIDRDHPLYGALLTLDRQRLSQVIPLARLGESDTEALIISTIGEVQGRGALVDRVQQRTEGNPFFVREVARALVERGDVARHGDFWVARPDIEIEVPERVLAVIQQRLDRLSEPAGTIVRDASVIGQKFCFNLLQVVSQESEDALEAALEQATNIGLLVRRGDDRYEFQHGLTQVAAYASLSSRRRRRLHLRVANALQNSPDAKNRTSELAWHFLHGDDVTRGIPYAVQAADQAQQVYAYGDAERLYRAALDALWESETSEPDTSEGRSITALVLEKLGGVLRTVGRYEEALETLERAVSSYAGSGDVDGERRTVALIARIFTLRGHPQEAIARLQSVLEMHGDEAASAGQVLVHCELAHALNEAGSFSAALHSAETAGHLARELSDARLLPAADIPRAAALGMLGRFEEAQSIFEAAVPAVENAGALVDALNSVGAYSFHAGKFDRSREYHERAARQAEQMGDPSATALSRLWLGEALFVLGRWQESRAQVEAAAQIAQTLDLAPLSGSISLLLARHDLFQGEMERARRTLGKVMVTADRDRDAHRLQLARSMVAEADLMAGDPESARAHLEPFVDAEEPGSRRVTHPALLMARVLLDCGEFGPAEEYLRQGLERATSDHNRPALVEGLCVRGLLRGRQSQVEEAQRLLAAALSLARAMSYPFMEARILQAWGEVDRNRGQLESAGQRLREALDLYERLGARPFVEQIASLRND